MIKEYAAARDAAKSKNLMIDAGVPDQDRQKRRSARR